MPAIPNASALGSRAPSSATVDGGKLRILSDYRNAESIMIHGPVSKIATSSIPIMQ